MSSDTITLELDRYESGVVFHSLKDKRNQMLKEGKDTELVDDVLMKVIEKIEVPPEKEKRGRRKRTKLEASRSLTSNYTTRLQ